MNEQNDQKDLIKRLNQPRGADVAPPPRKRSADADKHDEAGEPQRSAEQEDMRGSSRSSAPAAREGRPSSRPRARGKPSRHRQPLVNSVPGDVIRNLKETARETQRTYTDITLECIRACLEDLRDENSTDTDPLERRIREAKRTRGQEECRQITLYLTDEEREVFDRYLAEVGMRRSHLVTQALERGLGDIQ